MTNDRILKIPVVNILNFTRRKQNMQIEAFNPYQW